MPNVEYIPGGAGQNSTRVCQWMLQVGNPPARATTLPLFAIGAPCSAPACPLQGHFLGSGWLSTAWRGKRMPQSAPASHAPVRSSALSPDEGYHGLHPQVKHATTYMGCIGDDEFGRKMTEVATEEGVNVSGCLTGMKGEALILMKGSSL